MLASELFLPSPLDNPHHRFLPKLSLPLYNPLEPFHSRSQPDDLSINDTGVLYTTFNSPQVKGGNGRSSINAFWSTRSRVLQLHNFQSLSASVVAGLLQQEPACPSPMTLWALREDYKGTDDGRFLYCVYRTHEEACDTLSLPPSPLFSLAPALESDLEPLHKLKRVDVNKHQMAPAIVSRVGDSPISSQYLSSPGTSVPPLSPSKPDGVNTIRQSSSFSDFREPIRLARAGHAASPVGCAPGFSISSNPPNAKTNFRFGDWICASPVCGAHNFGRNVACIGCGSPRPAGIPGYLGQTQSASAVHLPRFPSPRFAAGGGPPYSSAPDALQSPVPQRRVPFGSASESPKSLSPYPILTPSGKQLSVGGKVQNISMNPLAPCFMFWSFNEPLPHPGQIRPTVSSSLQHPPILNTGNRGPIEHQPGDWVCTKCNYLNWRRRKVCQTCFPYAEGNGDSISTAVQAERIALLANVLSSEPPAPVSRDSCSLPPSPTLSLSSGAMSSLAVGGGVPTRNSALSRSRSHADLFRNHHGAEKPIYQTSGGAGYLSTPGPLLPSFLQDIVHSPTLSPASSASADFSSEDYEDDVETMALSPHHAHPLSRKPSSSLTGFSIWKLDGDEARALSGHSQEDL